MAKQYCVAVDITKCTQATIFLLANAISAELSTK